MPPADEPPRRRASDQYLEEHLRLIFEESLKDTRHMLRQELAAIGARVEANTLQSTKEHAEVQGAVAQLRGEVAEVKAQVGVLSPVVSDLKAASLAERERDLALGDLRRSLWRAAAVISSIVIAAAGVLVAVLN